MPFSLVPGAKALCLMPPYLINQRSAMTSMTSGKRSVPQGFVMGQHIGGCNDGPEGWMGVIPNLQSGAIAKALEEGKPIK